MRKRFKLVIILCTLLVGLMSVSCHEEELPEEKDERLVGVWKKLYEPHSHINFSIDATEVGYYEQILNHMILEDGVLNNYTFGDTIQFFEKGFFSESGRLLEEDVWDSAEQYYPTYKVVNGEELFVSANTYSSHYENRRATYEFVDEDTLILTIEYTDDYNLLRLHLERSDEYDRKTIRSLQVNKVNFTQTYRKINDVPYEWE